MEPFDELRNVWNTQLPNEPQLTANEIARKADASMKLLRTGQYLTTGILTVLIAILLMYFIWVGAHRLNAVTIGLVAMISVILVRIGLEIISVVKLKNIDPSQSLLVFSEKASLFYLWRRRIHIIFTPVIYVTYTLGFISLLPAFKENLSRGMYLYVLISGLVSLLVLAFFIARQIKKETNILNLLRKVGK